MALLHILPQVLALLFFLARADILFETPPSNEEAYEQCQTALSIGLDETITVDILQDAARGAVLMCSPTSDYYSITSMKSEWYNITGTGDILTATTCSSETDIDAYLTLYQDECITTACADADIYGSSGGGCPGLCVASSETPCPDGQLGTTLSWRSDPNRPYLVQVWQGRNLYPPIQQTGLPALEPCSGTATLVVTASPLPTNLNSCPNALPLLNSDPVMDDSSTASTVILSSCGGASDVGVLGDGLWYTLEGTGSWMEVPQCQATVDVYTGAACDQLSCLEAYTILSNPACSRNHVFPSAANQTYYLFATDSSSVLDPGFSVTVQEVSTTELAPNVNCGGAQALVADGSALAVPFDGALSSQDDHRPTLWYSLAGSGNDFQIQICGPAEVTVTTGSCAQAAPIDSLYSGGTSCTSLNLQQTISTAIYRLKVQSLVGATHFPVSIAVWEIDSALLQPNADCELAAGPIPYGSEVSGSLVDPTLAESTAGDALELALFFYAPQHSAGMYLQGTVCRTIGSGEFEVSLEENSPEFCSSAFYQGPGTLVSAIENGCRSIFWKSWFTFVDRPLIIGVRGSEEIGFTISVQEVVDDTPLNDRQPEDYRLSNKGYINLDIGSTLTNSTSNALSDVIDAFRGRFCDYIEPNKPGVWFVTGGDDSDAEEETGGDDLIEFEDDALIEVAATTDDLFSDSTVAVQDLVVCLVSGTPNSTARLAVIGTLIDIDALYDGCLPEANVYTDSACTTALRWPALAGKFYSILVQTTDPEEFEISLYNVTDGIEGSECLPATVAPTPESTTPATLGPTVTQIPQTSIRQAPTSTPASLPTASNAITQSPTSNLTNNLSAEGTSGGRRELRASEQCWFILAFLLVVFSY